jgi:hypothetical protein
LFTSKFHCEVLGKGIEFKWAHAKAKIRITPIREKNRPRANFIEVVKECIFPGESVNKGEDKNFLARVRSYNCAYHHLSRENDVAGDPAAPVVSFVAKQQLLFKEIERMIKKLK